MTDKLPWKSVKDNPLPKGDGVKVYAVRFKESCSFSNVGAIFYPSHYGITHWFELTTPEEELSLDEKLKRIDEWQSKQDPLKFFAKDFDDARDKVRSDEYRKWQDELYQKNQMDIVDKFQIFHDSFLDGLGKFTSFDQSEEQPQQPKQDIELWSVWQDNNNGNLVVIFKIDEVRFYYWDLDLQCYSSYRRFGESFAPFIHRPDLEVKAPALIKHIHGIEQSVYVNQIESKNYQTNFQKLYKWPESLAQMIVVEKEK